MRQHRTARNVPGAVLTLAEQGAIAEPSRRVNLQEIQQLRRSHGTLEALSLTQSPSSQRDTDGTVSFRSSGFFNGPSEVAAAHMQSLPSQPVGPTEKIAKRIPKHEKLSADLSRPVSQWDDKYHPYVHYPKNRQITNLSTSFMLPAAGSAVSDPSLALTAVAPETLVPVAQP